MSAKPGISMKKILVALDASEAAADVLRAAVDLASAQGAALSLLRVIEGAGELAPSREALVSEARHQLHDLARGVPAANLEAVIGVVGEAWREICATAQRADTDLVVLGASRHGALERLLGTTVTRVVNHCDRSVLVVRGWRGLPKRLLVALDASAQSAEVREAAVSLARSGGGTLRLFHVADMPSAVPADMLEQFPTIEDAVQAAAREMLGPHEQLVPAELRDGIEGRYGASVWRESCAAARDMEADLVVVGARGHGLSERLLGTTAGEVVKHADGSVLVVRRGRDEGGRPGGERMTNVTA